MKISIAAPDIGEEEKKAVMEVMDSGIIAAGPKVAEFEKAFAEYCGTKYGIAVSSGTAALHVALLANGVGPGDEVITSPFTFIASANSVLFTGAKPAFADIDVTTFNLDIESVKAKIGKRTKAIMPVHLYGQPCKMDELMELAEENDLAVIEDACQSHGAEFKGKKVGSFGSGCFSFYPTKNMTTSEGGMITTDDERVDKLSRAIRQHGMERRYYHDLLGFNLRSTDIAAAIGLVQLGKLDGYNAKRIDNARRLTEGIRNEKIRPPRVMEDAKHVFHQYTVLCEDRDDTIKALEGAEIGYGIYYPLPIHQQPYYLELGYREKIEIAEKTAKHCLSLPVHPKVTESDTDLICDTLNSI